MTPRPAPAAEKLLTRYLILRTTPVPEHEPGQPSFVDFTYIGEQLASSSADALRLFFQNPPAREGHFVAVSENAFKVRSIESKVVTKIGDPDEAVAAPVAAAAPAAEAPAAPDAPVAAAAVEAPEGQGALVG